MRILEWTSRRVAALFASALFVLGTLGCDGNGSNHPTAPATDLSGTWAGSEIVTWDWDPLEGGGSCTRAVTATFEQIGPRVSGTLRSSGGTCGGGETQYVLEGTFEGISLQGALIFPEFTWQAFGTLVRGELTIQAKNVRWYLRR